MPQHFRKAKLAQMLGEGRTAPAPDTREYEIVDQHHKPDLNGELAGAKVYYKHGKQHIRCTPSAAKFYVDAGSLRLCE